MRRLVVDRVSWAGLVGSGLALVFVAAVVSPGSSTAMPDQVRIPIVSPHPEGLPAALFRHSSHAQLNCYACHPGLFARERRGFTHLQMEGGRLCAACHDGLGAFAIAGAPCESCHASR